MVFGSQRGGNFLGSARRGKAGRSRPADEGISLRFFLPIIHARPSDAAPTMPARDPKKKMTKSQLMSDLADQAGLTKSQVEGVFDALQSTIKRELSGVGELTALPGLLKIRKVVKPARKARPGRNPATGEAITISAKPASKGVKVSLLKSLKEMV